ncbi:MAG: DUF421 domain-containing protein [Rhodanobacteraceae bacterium]
MPGSGVLNGMFNLAMPWWQFTMRAAIVYVVLLVLVRVSGKHTVGELSVFDLLVVIVVGTSLRTSMVGNDKSLPGGLLVVAVLLLMDFIVAWLASHFRRVDRIVQGRPVLLARDGVLFEEVLKRCKIPRSSFDTMLRRHGCSGIDIVEQAILEPSGTITVRKRSDLTAANALPHDQPGPLHSG